MFKMAAFTPTLAQDRVAARQAEAKLALAHAKTVIMCATAYANQARNPRKKQQRLNAPVVLKAHQAAANAILEAEELEKALRHPVTQ